MSPDTSTIAPDVGHAQRVVIEAFDRAGTGFDGPDEQIPEVLDLVLAEIAEKAAGSWEEAWRGREDINAAACSDLLTMVRAVRVLCGFAPTPQACDVNDLIRAKDVAAAEQFVDVASFYCTTPDCNKKVVIAFLIVGLDPNVGTFTQFDAEPSEDGAYQLVAPCEDTGGKLVAMSPHHAKPRYAVHVCKGSKSE